MANQQRPDERTAADKSQGRGSSGVRERHGSDRSPGRSNDRSSGDDIEKIQKPGDSDSDAARGADKSTNGEEFDREGRNPKPFSVS
jgi:hypothetical protein